MKENQMRVKLVISDVFLMLTADGFQFEEFIIFVAKSRHISQWRFLYNYKMHDW